MLKGSIIRVKTVELFDERTMLRNKAKWVYGVIAYLDDACEETGDKSWAISWATKHLHFSDEHYNHFLPQNESDIELVLEPGGEHIRLDKYYTTKDFFVMEDEEWKVKQYETFCEYCRKIDCDRMKYWEELDYAWSQMRNNAVHNNAKKENLSIVPISKINMDIWEEETEWLYRSAFVSMLVTCFHLHRE